MSDIAERLCAMADEIDKRAKMPDAVDQLEQWGLEFSTDADRDMFVNAAAEIRHLREALQQRDAVIDELREKIERLHDKLDDGPG